MMAVVSVTWLKGSVLSVRDALSCIVSVILASMESLELSIASSAKGSWLLKLRLA